MKRMLEVYNKNQEELVSFNIEHNKFLNDNNINAAEFEDIVYKFRTERTDHTLRQLKCYNLNSGRRIKNILLQKLILIISSKLGNQNYIN